MSAVYKLLRAVKNQLERDFIGLYDGMVVFFGTPIDVEKFKSPTLVVSADSVGTELADRGKYLTRYIIEVDVVQKVIGEDLEDAFSMVHDLHSFMQLRTLDEAPEFVNVATEQQFINDPEMLNEYSLFVAAVTAEYRLLG